MLAEVDTISTDAEGIDDMQRRRLQPPPDGLEPRIADALNGHDIGADALAELIAGTRTAITAASAAAEAARARAYDPAIVDPSARRRMEQADHLARRLRLAMPQLQSKQQKLHDAEEYRQWVTEFDAVKHKHTAASTRLRQVYTEFEQKFVSVLAEAHQVDAEVGKIMADKPWDNPFCNGDRKTLPSVECAARGVDGVADGFSLMTMRLPAFNAPNTTAADTDWR